MFRDAIAVLQERGRVLLPGLTVTVVVAAAATFLAEHYHAPLMLFALLLGIAMNFLSGETRSAAGIDVSSRAILRIGVALLGIRVTFDQIAQLGWQPPVIVIVSLIVTILVSALLARWLRFNTLFGFLTGAATAICGASAALALAAALPAHPAKEKATTFTVIGVSALSTLAMIAYPLIAHLLGLSPAAAGVFIGGTIHDVAQVVGAGYSMSQQTGDVATVVKLMRVAMLLPVIVCAAMITRARGDGGGARPPLLPWFAVGFVILAAINSIGWIGPAVRDAGSDVSRWCLAIAMSAIGMKTQLRELAAVGLKPVILMMIETVLLAGLVLGLSHWLG
ncbi:YeiH family protein [Povalibacter sp.]|uniref:YeiH family protein n=1 Tax=Povalibacter sp. TaxID=1962978 RepID=UPI0039C8FD89